MIGKIGPKVNFDLSPPAKTLAREGIDFRSFLKESLEETKPLERMALDYLGRMVASALSEMKAEGKNPLGMRVNTPSSGPQSSPPPPVLGTSELLLQKRDLDWMAREAGQEYGVDTSLIKAVIQAESGGNPIAVSPAGAKGLMQLMPGTAAEMGVGNPFDPVQNIRGGTRYLRKLLDRYQGDVRLALAAYNWGMGNVEARPEAMPRETRNYILKVENQYAKNLRSDV
jgi:soluble lytic murein transglycosylase-like protein